MQNRYPKLALAVLAALAASSSQASSHREAPAITRAPAVDVSSGVERAPGIKDPDKIRAFIRAARAAANARPMVSSA